MAADASGRCDRAHEDGPFTAQTAHWTIGELSAEGGRHLTANLSRRLPVCVGREGRGTQCGVVEGGK